MLRLLTGTCLLLLASSALAGPKKGKQADDDEDSISVSDDDSDQKPAKKKAKHKDEDTSDDSDKPRKKKAKAKADDADDADDKPAKKKAKADDADADDDKPKKKAKADDDAAADDKPAKKKAKADDADADDDKPKKKKKAKADDDADDDKPKKKKAKADDADAADDKPKKKKAKADDADDADDKPKKKKKAKADDADDADDKPKKQAKKHDDDDTAADDKPAKKTKKADDEADDDKPFKKVKKHKDDEAADDKPVKKAKKARTENEAEDKPVKKATKPDDDEVAAKKQGDFDPLATKKPSKADRDARKAKVDVDEIEMDEKPPPTDPSSHDDAPPLDSVVAVAPAPVIATPLAIGDRPLTLAKGRLEVHGGFPITVLTLPGAMAGTTTSATSEGFALGVTYGAGTKAELGADYTLSLNPGRIKGPFAVHGAYRWIARPKLDVGVAAALAVDFIELTDPMTMMTSTTTSYGVQLGAWVRYRITPMVSLFTGQPALPSASPSLSKLAFALPPLPYQVEIGLNNGGAIAVELPIGVGVQIKPQIYAFASLNLANIRIANTQNAFLFADFFPIALGGFYSLDKLDIGAVFADDLKQAGDHLSFELAARYLIK